MALALVIRVAYLILYQLQPEWSQLTVDNWYHIHWAMDVATGDVFGDTTYFRAPLYSWLLAPIIAVFGPSLLAMRLVGMAVGLFSVYMTFRLGARIYNRRSAYIAALIHALFPMAMYFEFEILLDPLFTLLFQLALYRLIVWTEKPDTRTALMLGLTIGLASLCRPTALILIPVVVLGVLFLHKVTKSWRQLAALVLGVIILVGPVFVRNLVVAGDPVVIASQSGINLYLGNNDSADGYTAAMPEPLGRNWQISQITHIAQTSVMASGESTRLTPGAVSDYWTDRAIGWMLDNPARAAGLYATKLYAQILDREISNNRDLAVFFEHNTLLAANPVNFGLVFALAVCGMVAAIPWKRQTAALVAAGAAYVLAVSFFFFNSRFRLPLMPIWFVFAGLGVSEITRRIENRRISILALLAIAVIAALISFNPINRLPHGRSVDASVSEGLYYYSRGNFTRALTSFRDACRIDSTAADIHLNLGAAFLRLGYEDSAMTHFLREKELHPLRPRAYENLASLALLDGLPAVAAQYAQLAADIAPYRTEGWILAMRAARERGVGPTVTDLLTQAREHVEDSLPVLIEAAVTLIDGGELTEASLLLQNAALARPPAIETNDAAFTPQFEGTDADYERRKAVVWYQLGYINGLQGRFGEAIEYSQRAIDADSSLAEAYANLVTGNLSLDRFGEADSILTDALARFPNHPQLLRLRDAMPRQ